MTYAGSFRTARRLWWGGVSVMASILVVDDRVANRQLLIAVLTSAGHDVQQAPGGEAALALALTTRPDLVMTDILMPEMDGYQFVSQLRAHPLVAATRVVFCSATYVEDEVRQLARSCGVDHILFTPYDPDAILEVAARALATPAKPVPALNAQTDYAHIRLLNTKLIAKVNELEGLGRRNALLTEELRSSAEQYRLLFDQNPLPMLVYARNTFQIIAANRALINSYGYSAAELLSMTIRDLLPPDDVDTLVEFLAAAPSGVQPSPLGGAPDKSWHHQYRDGTIIDVEVTTSNVMWEGTEARIALFLNVTERYRAAAELIAARDEAVKALHVKTRFLANMSHEIRTPMNGVIGMNELLLDTDLTDEQRFYVEHVAHSGGQMMAIINDILDMSKIEAGQVELDVDDFDLHEMIEHTCAVAGLRAKGKSIEFGYEIGPDVPHAVRGDCRRLRQVLLNLIYNAIKFTEEGAVTVCVTARPESSDGPAILFEVIDTGIGMEQADLERMFEPFTQADASTTRRYGGTGLGLAIAKELVEMMGGTMGAESEPRRGSAFWVELDFFSPTAPDGGSGADFGRRHGPQPGGS